MKECKECPSTCGHAVARLIDIPCVVNNAEGCDYRSWSVCTSCDKAGFWAKFLGADFCPNAQRKDVAVLTKKAVSALKNLVSYWDEGGYDAGREMKLKDEARAAIRALEEG